MGLLALPTRRHLLPARRPPHQAACLVALTAGKQVSSQQRQEPIRIAAPVKAKLITVIVMAVTSGTAGIAKRKLPRKTAAAAGARIHVIQALSVM